MGRDAAHMDDWRGERAPPDETLDWRFRLPAITLGGRCRGYSFDGNAVGEARPACR
ncbi:hypothetical protein M8494_17930 [Serratia ureilytica]